MRHVIPVGTSEPQDFLLRNVGAAINGTGLTVTLEIVKAGSRAVVDTPPTVAWLIAASGTVRVSGTESLSVGNYLVRFRLEDSGGDVGFVPNLNRGDLWVVVEVP